MTFSLILLAVIILMVLMVRFSSHDAAYWHVDPISVEKTANPNQYLLREGADKEPPVFDMTAAELAQKFDNMALAQPATIRLSGGPEDLWATYVQRTKVMAYPDYISVKFLNAVDERRNSAQPA